ncbi:hypothetical protein CVT25_006195, partial [Psilocybe cyanescens]
FNAIHYLVQKIKAGWQEGKVASVLFLNVEGAFPNAVTDRLIHNLKKCKIPKIYVELIRELLTNRKTKLKFDDYMSLTFEINNGIGQGNPLSMLLYIIYNADILEIVDRYNGKDAIGYIDDVTIITIGEDLDETTNKLSLIMNGQGGGLEWSEDHNSRFELSKLAVMHCLPTYKANRSDGNHPRLEINGTLVRKVESFKLLGVNVDSQLKWKYQLQKAVEKATNWVLNFIRLTKPTTGIEARLMRQLYIATVIPKMTYGLDIWYTPPTKPLGHAHNTGSVSGLCQLAQIQRKAALAIAGGLRSTPNELIDTHAGILPMELTLLKICHRAIVRMATLSEQHLLHQMIRTTRRATPNLRYKTPIDNLLHIFEIDPTRFEPIHPARITPTYQPPFNI